MKMKDETELSSRLFFVKNSKGPVSPQDQGLRFEGLGKEVPLLHFRKLGQGALAYVFPDTGLGVGV